MNFETIAIVAIIFLSFLLLLFVALIVIGLGANGKTTITTEAKTTKVTIVKRLLSSARFQELKSNISSAIWIIAAIITLILCLRYLFWTH